MGTTRKPLRARINQAEEPSLVFESLRSYYHSLSLKDQFESIDVLASMNDPDANRELMQIFNDCQWRATRLKIIDALTVNPTDRSLEFLFRHARNVDDIPMAERAIKSLGMSRHPLACRFLMHLYRHCSPLLKPAIAAAMGQIPDRAAAADFLKDLALATQSNQGLAARNLVLTLGELKSREALRYLVELVTQTANADLSLCALISIGKIARQPSLLESWESKFSHNLFEHQIYNSVKTQVYNRAQWRLEDYLRRVFEGPELIHHSLPYEFHHFDPVDVREGLKLYNTPPFFKRLLRVLSKIDFPGIGAWYLEFFDLAKLDSEQACTVCDSIAGHFSSEMIPLVKALQPMATHKPDEPLFRHWLKAMSLSLPEADEEFKILVEGDLYPSLTEDQRILVINALTNFGISVQPVRERLQMVGGIIERLLKLEKAPQVAGRLLRSAGSLGINSRPISDFVMTSIKIPPLSASCIYYLEQTPDERRAQALLTELIKNDHARSTHTLMLLRAYSAQAKIPEKSPALDDFILDCLKKDAAIEIRNEALRLLARHPRALFLEQVVGCLNGDSRLKLGAVIALKGFKSSHIADHLAPLLAETDRSLVGRTLDTLTMLPGMRAKRLVIDFLNDHADDDDVCDKVIRCLKPPESGHDYFTAVIDQILSRFPAHPRLEGLLDLREKLSGGLGTDGSHALPGAGADIAAIDRALNAEIRGYEHFDEDTKSALRSAEVPFLHPKMFGESIDKSASVLGFCKALDRVLANVLGRKLLMPRLESSLHEFQNMLHAVNLNENTTVSERVLSALRLEKHFTEQAFPLHKMQLIAQGILTGRILLEHFKVLDGLRAWAVVLLIFGRHIGVGGTGAAKLKPLIPLKKTDNEQLIAFCKRLMALQEVRNPAAHRQTLQQFTTVGEVRTEVFQLLNRVHALF